MTLIPNIEMEHGGFCSEKAWILLSWSSVILDDQCNAPALTFTIFSLVIPSRCPTTEG
jgi:hypothetical protein